MRILHYPENLNLLWGVVEMVPVGNGCQEPLWHAVGAQRNCSKWEKTKPKTFSGASRGTASKVTYLSRFHFLWDV